MLIGFFRVNMLLVSFISPIIPVAFTIPTDLIVGPFMFCFIKPNTRSTHNLVLDFMLFLVFCLSARGFPL